LNPFVPICGKRSQKTRPCENPARPSDNVSP
jgi:hypothetical protein